MAKYISGRSKLTPQTGLSSDRYRYLSVSESEPNLGDPIIGPSAYDPNLVPPGNQYIVVGVDGHPGERYWIPNQGGIIPGSLSVFEEGTLVGGLSSTTQLNFKGLGITAEGVGGANPGVAVTITVAPPGNNNSVLFKNNNDFATDARFTFDDGLFAAGDRITVGTGGTFITTTGIGSVGIGTTDPTQKLHLNGDFRITGTIYDSTNQPGSQGNLITKTATGGLLWVSPNAVQSGAGGTIGQVQFHNAVGLVDGGDNFYYDFNNNRVGIGSTQPTQLLDVLGVSTFSGGVFVDTLSVSGLSTFTGLIDANGGIDVFGHTETDTLNVSGLSTFVSNVDMDAGLDVDGHTELDNVNISGIASFTDTTDNTLGTTNTGGVQIGGGVGINSNLTVGLGISAQNLYITGVGTIGTFDFGTGDFDSITVSGVSTLGNVVVDGNTVSTKSETGNLIIDSDGETSVVVKDFILLQKTTESTSTNTGALQVDGGVGIDKSVNIGLGLNVGGAVSFTGPSVGVAVTLAAAGGITTTGGDLYVGGDLYINDDIAFDDLTARTGTFTESLDVTGHTETDTLNVSGISTFQDSVNITGIGKSIRIGPDSDQLQLIYDTGGTGYIQHNNELFVSSKEGVKFYNEGLTRNTANFYSKGAIELFHSTNTTSSKKFETTSSGVNITGHTETDTLNVSGISSFNDDTYFKGVNTVDVFWDNSENTFDFSDDAYAGFGNSNQLKVSGSAAGGTIELSGTSPTSGLFIKKGGTTESIANFIIDGGVELYYDNSKKFETTGYGVTVTGGLSVSGITTLGDANSDTVTFNARVDSSIIPSTNETFDLGSSSLKWNDVHATTFNGAFQGNADTATKIGIGSTNTNSSHFLTFVDSNNSSRDNELLYTNSGIVYNPSTGYLGIGTDNPTAKLEVATSVDGEATLATFKNTSGGGTNETVDIKLGLQNTVASNVILRAGKEGNHSSSGSADNFFAVHTTLDNTSSERLRITSDGNVSLTQNLLIPEDKKIHLEGSSSDDLNAIWKADTENTVFVTSRYNIANIIDSNNDDEVSFWSVRHNATTLAGSGELMRVQSNGNVGIGTDDPAEKLQVAGNVVPSVTETHDLGTSSLKWNNVHATTFTGAFQGNAESATKLDTPRTFTLGDGTDDDIVSIGKTFDGTQNVGFALTLKDTGPGIGTYGGENTKVLSLSIDDKGRITGITSTNIDFGNANVATADSLANSRSIEATGDIGWNVDFKGHENVTGVSTLKDVGPGTGTYGGENTKVLSLSIDDKGRITGITSTSIDFGTATVATADSLTNSRNFSASGDATAPNVAFDGTSNVDLVLTLANSGVTEGTVGSSTQVGVVTFDAKGRITAASNTNIDVSSSTVAQSDKIKVTERDTDATHYLTFSATDPDGSYEDLYGDDNLSYNPSDNSVKMVRYKGNPYDCVPAYSNTDYDSIFWDTTESAIRLQTSGTDDRIGMAFPAFRANVNSGATFKLSLQIKSDTTSSDGVYIRAYEYDGELLAGKTHVSHSASNPVVQEDTRRNTTFLYENEPGNTDWQTINFDYTPTSSAVWTSIVVLNWSGLGTNALWVRDLKRETIIGSVTNIGLSTNLAGGVAGSLPYQSAVDTTAFLAEPDANDKILSYNDTTNAPIWIDKSSAGVDNYVDSVSFSSGTLTLGRTGSLTNLTTTITLAGVGGTDEFIGLTDTPANYTSAAGKVVKVNSSGDALEFAESSSAGKTYTLEGVDSGDNAILRLSDGTTNDDVLITAGSNITIDSVAAGGFTISSGGFVTGMIILWSGAADAIPTGFVLCDGNNSTPDLRDKFVVGASNSTGDNTYPSLSPNATPGGSANAVVVEHNHASGTLSGSASGNTDSGGSHSHTVPSYSEDSEQENTGLKNFGGLETVEYDVSTSGHTGHSHPLTNVDVTISGSTANYGSSDINANLPPYYALCYIMKT